MLTAFAILVGTLACFVVRRVWGDVHAIGLAAALVGLLALAPAGGFLATVAAVGALAHARTASKRLTG